MKAVNVHVSHDDTEPVANEVPTIEEMGLSFPEQYREPLVGLLYLGHLEETFQYAGHTFVMRTLKEAEFLVVANLIKQYEGTVGHKVAYKVAIVAMSLVEVDGQPLYESLGNETLELAARGKFNVVKQWFPHVVDYLFERYERLDATVGELIEVLGKD